MEVCNLLFFLFLKAVIVRAVNFSPDKFVSVPRGVAHYACTARLPVDNNEISWFVNDAI